MAMTASTGWLGMLATAADDPSAGVLERGEKVGRALQKRWQAVVDTPKLVSPRVLVLEWPDPPFSAGHWVPEMVVAAGGTDVLGEAGVVSRRLSWSEVLDADPDLIVMAACGYSTAANVGFAGDLCAHPEARRLRASAWSMRSAHAAAMMKKV